MSGATPTGTQHTPIMDWNPTPIDWNPSPFKDGVALPGWVSPLSAHSVINEFNSELAEAVLATDFYFWVIFF